MKQSLRYFIICVYKVLYGIFALVPLFFKKSQNMSRKTNAVGSVCRLAWLFYFIALDDLRDKRSTKGEELDVKKRAKNVQKQEDQ